MIYLVSPATCALVLNQTTENFQEKSSLVVYKSKLNNTGMDQCFFEICMLIPKDHFNEYDFYEHFLSVI